MVKSGGVHYKWTVMVDTDGAHGCGTLSVYKDG